MNIIHDFVFDGAKEIAENCKYTIQFATYDSYKYMNMNVYSQGRRHSSYVCLSSEQMLEILDFLNKIYYPNKKDEIFVRRYCFLYPRK